MGSGYNILLEKSQRYPLSPKSQKSYPSTPVEGFCWDRVFPPDNTLGFSPPLGPAGVIPASAIIAEVSSPGPWEWEGERKKLSDCLRKKGLTFEQTAK